ncbi:MAG: tetratricopeptide repeat protein [Treponema sp.]|nr:tetratricopeptide repeat protein [Treponema sp.]
MIALYVRIDYHGQHRRIDPRGAEGLVRRMEETAAEYGARPTGRDHPFVAVFDSDSIFWRLQAIEALLAFRSLLRERFDGTMDFFVALHEAADEETLRADMDRAWAEADSPEDAWLSPAAARETQGYLNLDDSGSGIRRVLGPAYRLDGLSLSAQEFYRRETAAAALSEMIGELVVGGEKCVLILRGAAGTGKKATVARALDSLGYSPDRFLTLRGGTVNPRPFDPLACGITEDFLAENRVNLSPAEYKLYERLLPAYGYVFSSPFRAVLAPVMETGYRLFIGLVLRAYARGMTRSGFPPILVCENLHRFSAESLDLLGEMLVSSDIRIVATTSRSCPPTWPEYAILEWDLPPPDFEEYSGKLSEVLPGSTAETRKSLFSRARGDLPLLYRCALLEREKGSGPPPSEAVLGLMPREAAAALYAVSLCENVLDIPRFQEFLESLGLRKTARGIVLELLSRTGYLSGPGPRNASRMSNRRLAAFVGPNSKRIEVFLAEYLTHLYRNREAYPSLGLLAATREFAGPDRPRFEIDCVLSDALEDPQDQSRQVYKEVLPALRKLRELAACLVSGDESRAAARMEELEEPENRSTLPPGLPYLFKAELRLARREFPEAAKNAKEALLSARREPQPKLEARCHRILGLCSLARERPEEAIEYFENAHDISGSARDDYERLLCRWFTTLALFTSGRLDKALKAVTDAESAAQVVFRRDWEAACVFLRGRIHFEIGRYEEARSCFEGMRSITRAYGFAEAGLRAEIWDARALAYTGSLETAEAVLSRPGQDKEARFFRAELGFLRGDPADAAGILEDMSPWVHGSFDPAEKLFWDSGYRGIERRAFGASAFHPFDEDLRSAYACFARGLAAREGSWALRLYRMTREEKLSTEHPAFSTYLFFCFLLLERLAEPPLDKATVLSRAFKYLQERAGRIEDAGTGSDFLERNLWNRRLVEAARRYKFL